MARRCHLHTIDGIIGIRIKTREQPGDPSLDTTTSTRVLGYLPGNVPRSRCALVPVVIRVGFSMSNKRSPRAVIAG
eukprot:3019900-Rhodomonas_salina.2